MNILFITEFYDSSGMHFTGGVESRLYQLITASESKISPVVISRNKNQITASFLSIFPRLAFMFTALVKGFTRNFDLVEGSNFIAYLPAFIVGSLKRKATVAWYADIYSHSWFNNFSFPTALTGFLLEYLSLKLPWTHIIAMSNATKTKLINAGIAPEKITVIYGGVTLPNTITTKKFTRPTIITISRLVNYKHTQDIIKALARIKPLFPNIRLLIVGAGPELNYLKSLTKKLKLNSATTFTGNLPHSKALKLLSQSHLFSLASTVEGFGLVTAEAIAYGVPYINADIPVNREITHQGKGGILYPPRDVDALANAIITLITNQKMYARCQRQQLTLAKNYSWEIIAANTVNLFRGLIS